MHNPFLEINTADRPDAGCILQPTAGARSALEALIFRRHSWIFNIAFQTTLCILYRTALPVRNHRHAFIRILQFRPILAIQ